MYIYVYMYPHSCCIRIYIPTWYICTHTRTHTRLRVQMVTEMESQIQSVSNELVKAKHEASDLRAQLAQSQGAARTLEESLGVCVGGGGDMWMTVANILQDVTQNRFSCIENHTDCVHVREREREREKLRAYVCVARDHE